MEISFTFSHKIYYWYHQIHHKRYHKWHHVFKHFVHHQWQNQWLPQWCYWLCYLWLLQCLHWWHNSDFINSIYESVRGTVCGNISDIFSSLIDAFIHDVIIDKAWHQWLFYYGCLWQYYWFHLWHHHLELYWLHQSLCQRHQHGHHQMGHQLHLSIRKSIILSVAPLTPLWTYQGG